MNEHQTFDAGEWKEWKSTAEDYNTVPDINIFRPIYVERYGKDIWTRAVNLATRQRARASKEYNLTEHFTAWEWLDLCAKTGFRCSRCDVEAPLQAHHRIALSVLGSNTIDNLDPLCASCHHVTPVPDNNVRNVREIWSLEQETIYLRRPPVGALVGTVGDMDPDTWRLGVVISTSPAVLAPGPLWGYRKNKYGNRGCCSYGDYWIHGSYCPKDDYNFVSPFLGDCRGVFVLPEAALPDYRVAPPVQPIYVPAQAGVRWAGDSEVTDEPLHSVSVMDPQATMCRAMNWLREQDVISASWSVGDSVNWHQQLKQGQSERQGVIKNIVPCAALPLTGFLGENCLPKLPTEWVPKSAATVQVKRLCNGGTSRSMMVECHRLRREPEATAQEH